MVEESMAARFGKALVDYLPLVGAVIIINSSTAISLGASRLGFAPLLDGEENITRLYSHSHSMDFITPASGSMVPTVDHNVGSKEFTTLLPVVSSVHSSCLHFFTIGIGNRYRGVYDGCQGTI